MLLIRISCRPPNTSEGRITAYKVPKTYEFLDRLPRTDAGKLNRNALAEERA